MLEHIEIEPGSDARATVIWLHGLGADGHDFEPIVPELHLPDDAGIRFIFPHAPIRPITINDGAEMRGWYDFVPHSETAGADDIAESAGQIREFIDRELERGIPAHKILLAGFSQGGVIALHTALRLPFRVAGVLALSLYESGTSAGVYSVIFD